MIKVADMMPGLAINDEKSILTIIEREPHSLRGIAARLLFYVIDDVYDNRKMDGLRLTRQNFGLKTARSLQDQRVQEVP